MKKLLILFMFSCSLASAADGKPSYTPPASGRFQIIPVTPNLTIKLDTLTGQTWLLAITTVPQNGIDVSYDYWSEIYEHEQVTRLIQSWTKPK